MKKRHEHQLKRQDQINAGAYDGRYKVKVVPNKKRNYPKKVLEGPSQKIPNHPAPRMVFL